MPNAASTEVYRQLIRDDGVRILAPTIGRLERYAQASCREGNSTFVRRY